VVFGIGGALTAFRQIKKLPDREIEEEPGPNLPPTANSPFTTGKAASFAVEPENRNRGP
jgi:hypothetical protein